MWTAHRSNFGAPVGLQDTLAVIKSELPGSLQLSTFERPGEQALEDNEKGPGRETLPATEQGLDEAMEELALEVRYGDPKLWSTSVNCAQSAQGNTSCI